MNSRTSGRGSARLPVGWDAPAVTLEQVALRAGASPSTVSRILNGSAAVSAEKKPAVADASRALDLAAG